MRILSLLVGFWILAATCLGEGTPPNPVAPLTENVTIHVRGSFAEDTPCDIQLSGVGPEFRCNIAEPVITKFECSLQTTGDGKLFLSYVFGASVPQKSGGNVQYRDVAFQGRVAAAYGEDIKIATVNGKDFVLTVTKYAKAKK